MGFIETFKVILMIQLMFSTALTIIVYALPAEARDQAEPFADVGREYNVSTISSDITENFEDQQNIPLINVGALVFYSGNILLDLLGNFIFAIPIMLTLLLHSIGNLFSIDATIWYFVQMFATGIITIMYIVGLMQLVVGIRSGRVI